MPEQRQYNRRDSIFYLKVFDQRTDELLGHVVDLSERGVMMVSDEPMEPGRLLALRMHLPAPLESSGRTVDFEAESRWCRQEANPDLYDIGFEINDPPEAFIHALRDLIKGYTFTDRD